MKSFFLNTLFPTNTKIFNLLEGRSRNEKVLPWRLIGKCKSLQMVYERMALNSPDTKQWLRAKLATLGSGHLSLYPVFLASEMYGMKRGLIPMSVCILRYCFCFRCCKTLGRSHLVVAGRRGMLSGNAPI